MKIIFMAGHSKWKQIKNKKEAADKSRSQLFSKLSNVIAVAARAGTNPEHNPTLRNAIDQAKKHNMPQANIDRLIKRAVEKSPLELLKIEVYGPEGVGLLVEALTDSRNRTIAELRALLKNYSAKIAEPGSLLWLFEKTPDGYRIKFPSSASEEAKQKIRDLIESLKARGDIKDIYPAIEI